MRIHGPVLALCLLLATSASTFAQGTGVIVGANFAKVDVSDEQQSFDRRTGLAAGIFFSLPLSPSISVQPEVLYSQKGAKFEQGDSQVNVELDYLDVPVLVRATAGGPSGLVLFAGPSFGFKVRARLKTDVGDNTDEQDIGDAVESFDLGLVAGAGVQGGNFLLDARYQWGLSNVNKDEFGNAEVKNRVFSIMAGIRF